MGAAVGCSTLLGCESPPDKDGVFEIDLMSQEKVECLVQELFNLHDLSEDGTLSEDELIRINENVAILHVGTEAGCV